ncbi:MAG: MBL fold metallo-hydrolase [Chitinophagaceae bacterium]|jgi:pyrroloquinoline quinone biosynthesis protein B
MAEQSCFRAWIFIALVAVGCKSPTHPDKNSVPTQPTLALYVLGNVQDAGSPQLGCYRKCCRALWENPDMDRQVACLGVIDQVAAVKYLFDATPDINAQLNQLHSIDTSIAFQPAAVFLTHAHIGHYTGLMHFGREALNATNVDVYAMPRMDSFLRTNGPWQQLVSNGNIRIKPLYDSLALNFSSRLTVIPLQVPHRDEYSETVGYRIQGPLKSALFIPDIDKWEKWDRSLLDEIAKVDYAFLDATFFDEAEIGFRDIREIPHPLVVETMQLLQTAPISLKRKVWFIHMNHSNPLLDANSEETGKLLANGFNIARKGDKFEL